MILSSLIRPSCVVCGKAEERVCSHCQVYLKAHEEVCPFCHHYSPNGKVCAQCQIKFNPSFEGISIAFKATPPIRQLLIKLKYHHQKDISRFFAKFLFWEIQTNPFLKNKKIAISFVPSHRTKIIFKRGYSQAHRLAYHLAKLLNQKPLKMCIKAKNVKSQLLLSKYQREKNIFNAFKPAKIQKLEEIEYLILVDDILTT